MPTSPNIGGASPNASAPSAQQVEADLEQVLPWYQSTQGPGLSMTLTNMAAQFLPVINLVLVSRGIVIGPDWLDLGITLAVFTWFVGRAAFGYIQSKKLLGAQLIRLGGQRGLMGARPYRYNRN